MRLALAEAISSLSLFSRAEALSYPASYPSSPNKPPKSRAFRERNAQVPNNLIQSETRALETLAFGVWELMLMIRFPQVRPVKALQLGQSWRVTYTSRRRKFEARFVEGGFDASRRFAPTGEAKFPRYALPECEYCVRIDCSIRRVNNYGEPLFIVDRDRPGEKRGRKYGR